MTVAYKEEPHESWQRIFEHTRKLWPADDAAIIKLIGKRPEEWPSKTPSQPEWPLCWKSAPYG
jgi:hypothetical protein